MRKTKRILLFTIIALLLLVALSASALLTGAKGNGVHKGAKLIISEKEGEDCIEGQKYV